MGWKTINGTSYYYRVEREGDRVKTTYVGAGETAQLFSRLDAMTRARLNDERYEAHSQRKQDATEERDISEWFARVEAVADAAMIAAGYHKHKRSQWRRRRDGK